MHEACMNLSGASVQDASQAHTSVVECSPQPVRNRKSSGIKVPRKTLSGPYLHVQPGSEHCTGVQGNKLLTWPKLHLNMSLPVDLSPLAVPRSLQPPSQPVKPLWLCLSRK